MKKSIFTLLSLVLLGLATSCKKAETPAPVTNTVTVTKTDTVTKTVTVYDTVTVTAMNIIGVWKVYQTQTYQNNTMIAGGASAAIYDFTTSAVLEDLNGSGNYTYSYPATYGTNYVSVQASSTVTQTWDLSIVGNEYRITIVNGNQTQILFLKK